MIYEIYTENGTKKKRALTGNGYGLPLGTIIAVYSNTVPDGFLPCNGTTYDTTTYSALYAYLGSNKLPDLRECVLVGAGQSDNEYDGESNPNGIHEHDVYAVGEFKDDQIQDFSVPGGLGGTFGNYGSLTGDLTNISQLPLHARTGTTTHGKQLGVNYCIKATPAYVEPDTVSDMVNTLRTQDSYSTEEVNTGKKWIDGKPIYRKCFTGLNVSFRSTSSWYSLGIAKPTDLNELIFGMVYGADLTSPYSNYDIPFNANSVAVGANNTMYSFSAIYSGTIHKVVLEYTKTTD